MAVVPKDSIQAIAEARGIQRNPLSEDVATAMANDVDYRLREILQEAKKFMIHSKRNRLTTEDFNLALRTRDFETLYGYSLNDPSMFVKAQKDPYIIEEKELDLAELASRSLPPLPQESHFSVHWLAIEGVQPQIPQNPLIRPESEQPSSSAAASKDQSKPPEPLPESSKPLKHVPSKELQTYFQKVIDSLGSSNLDYLAAALSSVGNDPGLHQLLPYFSQHIGREVAANLQNGPMLMALMGLVDALISNPYLHPEPYVHQLIPAVLTCLVGKKLCSEKFSPEISDHWKLRDLAGKLSAKFVAKFGKDYEDLQPRITKTLLHTFMDPLKPLPAHYGAIRGILELGRGSVLLLLVPHMTAYVTLLKPKLTPPTPPPLMNDAIRVHAALVEAAGFYLKATSEHFETLKKIGVKSLPALSSEPKPPSGDLMDLEGHEKKKKEEEEEAQQPQTKKPRRENTNLTTQTRSIALEEYENIAERYEEFTNLFGEALQPYIAGLSFFS